MRALGEQMARSMAACSSLSRTAARAWTRSLSRMRRAPPVRPPQRSSALPISISSGVLTGEVVEEPRVRAEV
ncbi:MAG: hypothetical protein HYX34_03880 [Actinobacteria bacterium]|nr:hypothetical protein [Actinomycetota bacterium]